MLCAAPPGSSCLTVWIREASKGEWRNVKANGGGFWTDQDVVAEGLEPLKSYEVKFCAKNSAGWGPSSPVSAALKIDDFVPLIPGAPVLEAVKKAGSIRVRWTAPPGSTHITVFLSKDGATKEMVDAASGKLGRGDAYRASPGTCLVTGLDGGAWYTAYITAMNAMGWSSYSPESKPLELKDDELEVTGSRSWAERDAELRKRAIDVDQAGPSTETVGIKKESKIARK